MLDSDVRNYILRLAAGHGDAQVVQSRATWNKKPK